MPEAPPADFRRELYEPLRQLQTTADYGIPLDLVFNGRLEVANGLASLICWVYGNPWRFTLGDLWDLDDLYA